MKISVIVPIYGVEKYLEKCLRSLFTQTKTDGVEFILVNDCTKDNSMLVADKVISEFPSLNIKIINHEKNSGLAVARNTGVQASIGEYIQHIDSDDWVEPTMLEDLYKEAKETDADIICCDYYIDDILGRQYMKMPAPADSIDCLKKVLSTELTQSLCFKLVRRSLYKDDVDFYLAGVDTWEDLLASVKLFYFANRVAYLPKAYYHYVQLDTNSISRSGFSQKRLDNIIAVVNNIDSFFKRKEIYNSIEEYINYRKVYAKYSLIRGAGKLQKKYSKTFPEINKYIFYQKGMPFHNRLALFLASHKCIIGFNFIIFCVKIMKTKIRKLK